MYGILPHELMNRLTSDWFVHLCVTMSDDSPEPVVRGKDELTPEEVSAIQASQRHAIKGYLYRRGMKPSQSLA